MGLDAVVFISEFGPQELQGCKVCLVVVGLLVVLVVWGGKGSLGYKGGRFETRFSRVEVEEHWEGGLRLLVRQEIGVGLS